MYEALSDPSSVVVENPEPSLMTIAGVSSVKASGDAASGALCDVDITGVEAAGTLSGLATGDAASVALGDVDITGDEGAGARCGFTSCCISETGR